MAIYTDNAAALADGMLHYVPMNELSGQIASDKLAQGYDISLIAQGDPAGATIETDGLWGRACRRPHVPGTPDVNAELIRQSTATAAALTPFGISFWFWKPNGSLFDGETLLDMHNNMIQVHTAEITAEDWVYVSFNTIGSARVAPTTGTWHNIIVTADLSAPDGSWLYWYFDGVLQHDREHFDPLKVYDAVKWPLGWDDDPAGRHYDGKIQDLGIWGRLLTAADASAIWNGGTGEPLIPVSTSLEIVTNRNLLWDVQTPFPAAYYAKQADALADGMIHYVPLAEDAGDLAKDFLAINHDLTLQATQDPAGATIVDGLWGKKARQVSFPDGTVARLQPQSIANDLLEIPEWTVSFWFYEIGGFGPSWRVLLQFDNLFFQLEETSATLLWTNGVESFGDISVPTIGAWHHCLITYGSVNARIFIDGVSGGGDAVNPASDGLQLYTSNGLGLGAYGSGGDDFPGIIQDLGVWNRDIMNDNSVGAILNSIWNGGAGRPLVSTSGPVPLAVTRDLIWNALNPIALTRTLTWRVYVTSRRLATLYRARITGATDGVEDYSLRLSSFSARLKSGTPSTVTLTAAWQNDIASAIAARPSGDLVVERVIESTGNPDEVQAIITAAVDELRTDEGGRRRSIQITGSRQTTNSSPVTVALQRVSYRGTRAGALQLRANVDDNIGVQPGDIVTYQGESLTTRQVVISMANGRESMEIT